MLFTGGVCNNMAENKPRCIIHMNKSTDEDEHLISPVNYESWLTLLEAARIRNHEPLLKVSEKVEEEEIPKIYYHRKCRSLFTMKRDLDNLKRKAEESPSDEAGRTSKRPSRKSSIEARVYEQKCIFCDQEKRVKSTQSREKLVQAVQLRADKTLRECAIQRGDDKIIAVTSRDIVAAEAHYHISCYKKYTKKKSELKDIDQIDTESDEDERYQKVVRKAYEKLFEFIRSDVLDSKSIVPVTLLTEKLESIMLSLGVQHMQDTTRKHIRRKLETELGESVDIFPDNKGKLLMVPDSVLMRDIVIENQNLQRELKNWKTKSTDVNRTIDKASSHIRSIIKEEIQSTPWPLHPADMKSANIVIPNSLERFLCGVLAGDPDSKHQTERTNTLVQSFSQDIIYAVSCGQHKPPKHILLPNAVKTLTGNVELIRVLNKLRHGISYSQLEENDTALCLQKLAAGLNRRVVIPASIKPNVFTNLAWDNIDRLEETLTGKGTSHRVNGIATQPIIYGPFTQQVELPRIEKQKQRSVTVGDQELEVYIAGTRVGPQPLSTADNTPETKQASLIARKENFLWMLARLSDVSNQSVPSWTGFNICIRDQELISEDVVGYLPTINAPATDLSTVFEILNQSELIRLELHLETIVVVMDQALYAKATEIVWKHKERFSHILLRMGTFHTICNALSILGKRFRDAGLKDICIESGIVAEGSINGVLDGKHYNRAVRIHKCIYEALLRLAWSEFIPWVEEKYPDKAADIKTFLDQVNDMVSDINQQNHNVLLQSQVFQGLVIIWQEFLKHLRVSHGELSTFWMSYIDFVEDVILGLLQASREGNWNLHLHAIRKLIPWCFAYDKLNYARYLSPYFAQMTNLSESHHCVYEAFQSGQFAVQISGNNPFGRIPVDQTTEITVNKDTQTPGGTARFSLKAAAIKRYYITAEYRSSFLGLLRQMVGEKSSDVSHTELQRPRIQKDEEAVSAVTDLVKEWINPFAEKQDLVSISTARVAPREITTDLLHAYEIGEEAYANFRSERLEADPPNIKFHDPMKTQRLKTFSNLSQKQKVKSSGRVAILKADRTLFGRIIVMAQGRNLQMESILSYPLGPLPWALSTPDGMLRKTNKAALAAALQKNVSVAEQLPENSASVIDGMSLVQKVKGDQTTFGDVAKTVFAMALRAGVNSDRIDVVFDTYLENSIKNSERLLRGGEDGPQLQNITSTQIVRQWRSFLSTIGNKNSIIKFLVNEWMKPEYKERLHGKVFYANVIEKCYKITSQDHEEVADLQSHQEEADGRLLLHAAHAARQGYSAIQICSEDTDVFIMALAFRNNVGAPMYMKCGSRNRTRLVDVNKVATSIGTEACRALVGLHSFTGCDTVSAFAGKGKASALKLLTGSKSVQEMFQELGQEWDLSDDLMDKLEAFTCRLYAPKASSRKVNDLRYDLFCAKKGEIESHQLPPCLDCLMKHCQRANYQAAIWQRCLHQEPEVPSPVGRGWRMEKEEGVQHLVVHWMDLEPAPEAVLDLLACNCTRKCTLPKCVCMKNGLNCTDMCKLADCENRESLHESDSEVSGDENTEDIDNDNDW